MKAWRIYEPNHLKFDEMDAQPVGEGCVKLKMLRSAVSQMDVRLYTGKLKAEYPLILGRQGVGMVTEVGEGVTSYKRGDRVAVNPVTPCRSCSACVSGHPHECTHTLTYGMTEDGFLRDFAVVPADDLIGLPDRISDTDAIFLEHIAMAINTVGALDLEKGEHIVVYGATLVGLILAQAAIYYQAVPVLVDMRADRLSLAESLGVYYTVNPVESDPFKKIFTITGGRMAETVAFMADCGMRPGQALSYVAAGGRVAFVGWKELLDETDASIAPVIANRLKVTGVSCSGRNMPSAVNMLANKAINVEKLVSKEVGIEQAGDIIAESAAYSDKYLKVPVKI